MRKTLLLLFILSSSLSGFSQESTAEENAPAKKDIFRSWQWISKDNTAQFEMKLAEVDGALKGSHCSVVYNGKYLDCSYQDTSIDLKPVGLTAFEGRIRSGYSNTFGKIRITYDNLKNTIHFQLLEEPTGIFYLPKDVVMY